MNDESRPSVLASGLLIGGAAVGAGILGLPVKAGLAGVIPSLLGMTLAWLLMLGTGCVLADRIIARGMADQDLPTLLEAELGTWGKWTTILGYGVLFYGVLVAYLAASGSILQGLFGDAVAPGWLSLVFFVPATALCLFGVDLVRRSNALLMVLLGVSFVVLTLLTLRNLQPERLMVADWHFLPSAMPVIIAAFAYHVVIPTTCRALRMDRRRVFGALLIGTSIPLLLNVLWTVAVVGALQLDNGSKPPTPDMLIYAYEKGQPATVPLAVALDSKMVLTAGLAFSLCAVLTSYLAVGIGLMGFLRDLAPEGMASEGGWVVPGLTFLPPLAVALLYPGLFLSMLDLVGGGATVLVFGILPSLILLRSELGKRAPIRVAALLGLILFVAMMGLEVSQELGLLKIRPNAEYWLLEPGK